MIDKNNYFLNNICADTDLNIFYEGGSGGFIFLHLVLLSKSYSLSFHGDYDWFCKWVRQHMDDPGFQDYVDKNVTLLPDEYPENPDQIIRHKLNAVTREENFKQIYHDHDLLYSARLPEIINQQWDPDRTAWKNGEVWPDNQETKLLNERSDRNKIYFTLNHPSEWLNLPGFKIRVWTDIRSQIRLAWFKKAWFFVKAGHSTLMSHRKLIRFLIKRSNNSAGLHNLCKHADAYIKLQDLINSTDWNNDQLALLQCWRNQHPNKLLSKIGIRV